jgi:hypothetical protein
MALTPTPGTILRHFDTFRPPSRLGGPGGPAPTGADT